MLEIRLIEDRKLTRDKSERKNVQILDILVTSYAKDNDVIFHHSVGDIRGLQFKMTLCVEKDSLIDTLVNSRFEYRGSLKLL
jgi:hypothetical protein